MRRVLRSRFVIAFFGLLALNACAWWLFVGRGPSALELLRVERQDPAGPLVADTRPKLTWRFNLAVADRDPAHPPVLIRPNLPGAFAWEDEKTLVFTPERPLPVATQWDFVVARDRVKSVEGCVLPADVRATRQTASLRVVSAKQIGFADDLAAIELTFNDAVLPGDVAARVAATHGRNAALRTRVAGDKPSKTVVLHVGPIEPQVNGKDVTVSVRKGLSASAGTLGLAADQNVTVAVTTDLVLDEIRPSQRGQAFDVCLDFNGTVDANALAKLTSVQPAVAGLRVQPESGRTIRLSGDFLPATRYAVTLAAAPAGDKSALPRPETRTVFLPDFPSDVGFEHDTGYLSAAGSRTVHAWATNVGEIEVEAFRVYDSNLVQYSNTPYGRVRQRGTRVAAQTVRLDGRKNQRQDVAIKLDELLPPEHRGDGVFELTLRPTSRGGTDDVDRYDTASTLVSLSDIGLTAKIGNGRLTAWALSLAKATPLAGTRVRVYSDKNQLVGEGSAGADGVADVALRTLPDDEQPSVIVAERDGVDGHAPSVTALKLQRSAWDVADFATAGRPYLRRGYEAFVYADRGAFRPGEAVPVRAIVRGTNGAVPPPFPVQWVAVDARGRTFEGATMTLDTDGCAAWSWPTSDATPTGTWQIALRLPGGGRGVTAITLGETNVQVEDFLPDRMKVALALNGETPTAEKPRRVGPGTLDVGVQADYLFGQPAAGATAEVNVSAQPVAFAPPQWPGYTFHDAADARGDRAPLGNQMPARSLTLDGKGNAHSPIDLKQLLAADDRNAAYRGAWRVRVEAGVRDDGGRTITRSAETAVDLAADYVGLWATTPSTPGAPTTFDVALVTPDGQPSARAATVQVRPYRVTWNSVVVAKKGRYAYESTRVLDAVADAAPKTVRVENGRGTFAFTPPTAGTYVLAIGESDDPSASVTVDVSAGEWDDSVSRGNPERLEVSVAPAGPAMVGQWLEKITSPDASAAARLARPLLPALRGWLTTAAKAPAVYAAGSLVNVTVKSPFAGTLLLSVETDRVIERRTVAMTQPAATFLIRLGGNCRPNAFVSASVVRGIDPATTWRTHRAYGLAAIKVDEPERRLGVAITAPDNNKPGRTMPVGVRVVSSDGRPVANAAVTVAAVDEGVLAVTNFTTPKPAEFFAAKRALGVDAFDLYGQLVPDGARPEKSGNTGGDGDPFSESMRAGAKPPVSARRVKPVALRSGVLHTDADGVARTDFPLPQFSGTLRLMAVASAGGACGSADRAARTRGNVIVQTSWPRFAAPGDRFAVPVTVFNTGPADAVARVRLDLHGPVRVAGDATVEIAIPAGGQATYTLDATANAACGLATASVVATMNGDTAVDAVEFPVRPPSAAVTLSDTQTAEPGRPVSFDAGPSMLDGTDVEQILVSPQPQLVLPEGLDYLNRYPYGCCEQTVSGLMPLLALGDLGASIDPLLFKADDVKRKIDSGLSRLTLMQRGDGGLSMWPGGAAAWPTGSVYAAHFVAQAGRAGYATPQAFRENLFDYVRSLASQSSDAPGDLETQAYACYVLALADRPERAAMNRLAALVARPPLTDTERPTAPTRLLLAAALAAAGQRTAADALVPTAAPDPRSGRDLGGTLGSPVADRALVLGTLLTVRPQHPTIAGLAQQLAALGRHGEWRSTHDTALALVALAAYEKSVKDVQPFKTARLTVGDTVLAAVDDGRELRWNVGGDRPTTIAPTTRPAGSLVVTIDGPPQSRGYVTRLHSGVPLAPPPAEAGRGLKVARRWLTADGKATVDPGKLATGQIVRVELTISADREMDNVVVEDLLPAGLEVENPRLAGTAVSSPASASDEGDPFAASEIRPLPLIGQPDIRDDRVVLFTRMPAGVCKYEYLARAVTAGTFVAPPLRAECMYDRSIFGQTAAGTVTVSPVASASLVHGDLP